MLSYQRICLIFNQLHFIILSIITVSPRRIKWNHSLDTARFSKRGLVAFEGPFLSLSDQPRHNIGENTLLCLFALILGTVLAKLFFIPSFSSLFDLPLKLDFLGSMRLSAFLVSMLMLTSLGGSAYPAFYVSGFQPASILKGKQKPKGKSLFTRILLTFQFVLTFITVTTAIILVQNAKYQKNRDWGYNQNQVIVVRLDGKKGFGA